MKRVSFALKIVSLLGFILLLFVFFPGWKYAENTTLFYVASFCWVISYVAARYIDKRTKHKRHS